MGIDAGDLWRGVSTHAQHASRQLVHQLEGLQIQRFTGAGQQGLQMLQQRWNDQFIAVAAGRIQQAATKLFDVSGLGRQDIGNVIRQDPSGHVKTDLLNRRFYRA